MGQSNNDKGDNLTEKKLGNEWTVLSVTTVGTLMAVMQSSALLISLPDIMSSLHMDLFTVMWVLLIYMLITTAMIPLFGRLADMYGRKNLYVLGFIAFTLGSLLCVFADPSNRGYDLIAYRIVQAMGGALMMATATPMVADAWRSSRLGLGLSISGIAAGSGLVLGPVVGGVLAPYGWQWIFLYNVPIGIFGTVWAYVRLKEMVQVREDRSFDWAGCTTFLIGMTSLLLAVSLLAFPMGLGSEVIYALLAIGVLGMLVFLYVELKVKEPMLDLHLFRNADFALGCTTNFINSLTRGAMLFLLIFFLQGPYGQDPLTAGLSLIPMGLTMIIMAPISGRAADKQGVRRLMIAGLALTSLSMLAFAFIDHATPFWWLVILMLVSGVAGSLFMSPNSKSVMNAAPPNRRGIASGTRMMLQNVGSMVSMAVAMPLVLTGLSDQDMAALFLYGGGISTSALTKFESGLHQAFLLFLVLSLIALGISLVKIRPPKGTSGRDNVPYRRILVATDGSEKSQPATSYGLKLAKNMGSEVTAICVIDDVLDVGVQQAESVLYQRGQEAVGSVVEQGKDAGVNVRPIVASGIPTDEIVQASFDHDLIIMGTAGRTGVSHLLLGSVAEKVVRYAHSPVLVVHGGDELMGADHKVGKVLIATDGSNSSTRAIAQGLTLAKLMGAQVTALSVCAPGASSPGPVEDASIGSTEACQQATKLVVEEGEKVNVTVLPVVLSGTPAEEIVKTSTDHDLIVMGTVGRTGLAHIRLGSVAEKVVRQASCPVLVVRTQEKK